MKNQAFKVNLAGQTYKIRNTLAPYTLSITHNYFVESVTVIRELSKFPGAHLGEISNNDIVYLGDELTISATAVDGCTLADYITQITVKGNVKVNIQANPPVPYLLNISYTTGVESVTVIRESSNFSNVPLGKLTNGSAIYTGDVLIISATPALGYSLLDYASSVVVSGNVNVSIGAEKLPPAAYKLNISWGSNVSDVTVMRESSNYSYAELGKLSNNSVIYEGDRLSVVATAVDGSTLAPYENDINVSSDTTIHITIENNYQAHTQGLGQSIVLPSGDKLGITPGDSSYGEEHFVISSDMDDLQVIWDDCHWGYFTVPMHEVTPDKPIEFYKLNGYESDAMSSASTCPDREAEVVRDEGTYLGTIWIDDQGFWHVEDML
jgi:hypothetical protein